MHHCVSWLKFSLLLLQAARFIASTCDRFHGRDNDDSLGEAAEIDCRFLHTFSRGKLSRRQANIPAALAQDFNKMAMDWS